MFKSLWQRTLKNRRLPKVSARRAWSIRPGVEVLEDRALPSTVGDVFVILMENHNWTQPNSYTKFPQIQGNTGSAPYITQTLTSIGAYANEFLSSGVHPSEPNYIWLEAGNNLGKTTDDPTVTPFSASTPNFTQQLTSAGISWKSYQEDIDINTTTGDVLPTNQWTVPLSSRSGTIKNTGVQYAYAPKHNPTAFFAGATTANNVPLQQLQTDLDSNSVPQFSYITPNLYNDMHSLAKGSTDLIKQGDDWLAMEIPKIMASQAYQNNGAIMVVWDETEGGDSSAYTKPFFLISPLAKAGYSNSVVYTQSSVLKTLEEIEGVPYISGAGAASVAAANDLSDLFMPGTIQPHVFASVSKTGVLTLTKTGGDAGITITEGATFGELTVSIASGGVSLIAGGHITSEGASYTTTTPITGLTINLGPSGTGADTGDTLDLDGTQANGPIDLSSALTITGTGNKTISLESVNSLHGGVNITLPGGTAAAPSNDTVTFTDVNVAGAVAINHPGFGNASVTLLSSGNVAHTWGSLAITDGQGTATNAIGDTNFLGNVIIKNGIGGGSTIIAAKNDHNLPVIGGSLNVTTTSGTSDTELYDYHVQGSVTINAGSGVPGTPNFVGLENLQTVAAAPVINGKVTISGHGTVDVGTNADNPNNGAATNFPLTVLGNVAITADSINLNDLIMPAGTTTLNATQSVAVQAGMGFTSVFDNFKVVAPAVTLQDTAGTLVFGGNVSIQNMAPMVPMPVLAPITVEIGADTNNDAGVAGALVEFFGTTTIRGGSSGAGSTFFGAPGKTFNSNISFFAKLNIGNNFNFS